MRINKWVNEPIKPMTDLEHWGVVEKWSYPDDGYGDCEDYVLLKRRMLIQAGWPREALLITVVRDKKGEGHAVLTVKTDKGEFILDNQNPRSSCLVGHRLPLRQAPVAERSEYLGLARRFAPGDRDRNFAVTEHFDELHWLKRNKELREPGHVPTPPRPQTGFARGRLSPRAGRTFLMLLNLSTSIRDRLRTERKQEI